MDYKQIEQFAINHKITISAVAVGIVIIIIVLYLIFRTPKSDSENEAMILGLHPKIRTKVRKLLYKCKKELGYDLRIYQGMRTIAEQNTLYAQGRSSGGAIVTNARGGESMHNYGLAIDLVDRENGFNIDYSKIYDIAKDLGFEWGQILYPSLGDKNHFEINFGKTTGELSTLYDSGKTSNGFVNL